MGSSPTVLTYHLESDLSLGTVPLGQQTGAQASSSLAHTSAISSTIIVGEPSERSDIVDSLDDARRLNDNKARESKDSVPDSDKEEQDALSPDSPHLARSSTVIVEPPAEVPNKRSGSLASKRKSSSRMRADSPDPLNAISPPTKRSSAAELSAEPAGRNKRARRSVVPDLSSESNRIIDEAEDKVEAMEDVDGGYEGGDARDNTWDKKKKGEKKKKGKKAAVKPKAGKKGKAAAVPVSKELVDDSDMEVDGPPAEPVAPKAGASKEDSIVLDAPSPSKEASPAPTTSRRTSGKGVANFSISLPMHKEGTPDPAQEAAERLKALAARKSMVPEVEEEPEEEPEPVKPPPKKRAGKKGSKKAKAVPVVEEEEPAVEEEPAPVEDEPAPVEEEPAVEAEPIVEEEPESPRAEPKKKGRRAQAKKKVVAESSDNDEEGKILSGEESEAEEEEEGRPAAKKGKAKGKAAAKKSPAAGKKGGAKKKKAAPEPEPDFKPVDEDAMDEDDKENKVEQPAPKPVDASWPQKPPKVKVEKKYGAFSVTALCAKHTTGFRPPGLSKRAHIPSLLSGQRTVKVKPPIPQAKNKKKKDSDDEGSDLETEAQKAKRKRREAGFSSDDGGYDAMEQDVDEGYDD